MQKKQKIKEKKQVTVCYRRHTLTSSTKKKVNKFSYHCCWKKSGYS